MLLKTQFQYISSLFSYFYFSSFSFPLSSFTMDLRLFGNRRLCSSNVFVPLSGPFFSGQPAHRPRGLSGATFEGRILLGYFSPALSYGPKLSSFSSRRRHPRASSTLTAFCPVSEDHGGVVKAAYGVIQSKHSSNALCLTLCATAFLSTKAALPTKRDFNYRAMGFASGSRDVRRSIYPAMPLRLPMTSTHVCSAFVPGVLRNAIIFCSRWILDFEIH